MNKLEVETERTVKNLEHYERNWHLFKAGLFICIGLVIILVQLYTFHKLLNNSENNRQLLRCTIVNLTAPQTPQQFRTNLQACLDKTK